MGKKIKCYKCGSSVKPVRKQIMGVYVKALKCPKCKEVFYTEELAERAAARLEERRVKEQYKKHPIQIGHSWGLTFPKDIVRVFGLDSRKTELSIKPKPGEKTIEIKVG